MNELQASIDAAAYSSRNASAAIWPSTAHLLSDDVLASFAAQAARADELGVLSDSAVAQLRESGYFGLPIPAEMGGGGAGLLECAAVQRRLGGADPALAIAANMHLFSVGMAAHQAETRRDSCGLLLEAIATQQRIIASAFAEPGLAGSLLRSSVRARRTSGGYLVSGVKSPCSLAAHCDLVCLQMLAEPAEPAGLMMAVIPAKTQGIRVERSWDTLGMRASGSDTLVFDDCFIPDALVYHRCEPGADDDDVFATGLVWLCVTTTAVYLGLVDGALETACAELRGGTILHLASARAALPSVQGSLGDLLAPIWTLECACAAVAERADRRGQDIRSLVPLAIAIKQQAVEACIRAVEGAAELVGGKSYGRTHLLARLWRDVQALRFHTPSRLASRQLLGKWALGEAFRFELSERADADDASSRGP